MATEPIGDDRQHRSDHFRHADCAEYDAPNLAFFATSEPTRHCLKKAYGFVTVEIPGSTN